MFFQPPHPDDPPPVSIPVGITIGLLASFVQSLGLTIQRKSHVLNERQPEHQQTVGHRRPLWLVGFAIFISSNLLGSLVQIASLPVVILAPLGAVSLLWNAFFARLLLGDVFSPYMIFGTIAIAGGAVLIAIFGIVPEPTHSLESLLILFARKAFIVYFTLLGAAVLGCLVVTHIAEFSFRHRLASPPNTPPMTPPLSPLVHTSPLHSALSSDTLSPQSASERTPLLLHTADDRKPAEFVSTSPSPAILRTRLLLAVSYASVSGILSGMCLLFAKSGVELLILTAKGDNQFWRWEAWALVGGLIVFALLQLWYLHKSLILANPVLVCPLAFCCYNLSSIVNGLVYYDQFGALTTLHLWLVILGIIVLLGGVWAVSVTTGEGGGVEPGTWHEGEEAVMNEQDIDALPVIMSPERPGYHTRNTSCPTSPLADPQSPNEAARESLSPARSRRSARQRYASLLVSEGQAGSLGGLSIGLSPVSPGFALRPTRRRSSNNTLAAIVDELGRRRTLSETDVGPADSSTRAKARWKWLRHVWRRSMVEQGAQ
ncbi:hypothetical protein JB92DRAFT_2943898 [Gautieria morchelliformis]|nr:hypothetical protein JB92DRAFT_2943898 [Gautieria morchelliformis]